MGIRLENQSLGVHMSRGFKKVLGVISCLTLLGLNFAFVAFFTLWQIADSAAINRMEMAAGVDPAQMLGQSCHRSRSVAGVPSQEPELKR